VDDLDRQKRKQSARKPQPREHREDRFPLLEVPVGAHAESAGDRKDDEKKRQTVQHTRTNAKPSRTPLRSYAPDGSVPETLRQKDCRKNRQRNDDSEE
jgi:hypothetical protein